MTRAPVIVNVRDEPAFIKFLRTITYWIIAKIGSVGTLFVSIIFLFFNYVDDKQWGPHFSDTLFIVVFFFTLNNLHNITKKIPQAITKVSHYKHEWYWSQVRLRTSRHSNTTNFFIDLFKINEVFRGLSWNTSQRQIYMCTTYKYLRLCRAVL